MRDERFKPETYYDQVTLENMRDVGEGRQFDFLYRQEFKDGRQKAEIIKADTGNRRVHFLDVVFLSYDVPEAYRHALMHRMESFELDWDYSGGSSFWDFESRDSKPLEGQIYIPDPDGIDEASLEDLEALLSRSLDELQSIEPRKH